MNPSQQYKEKGSNSSFIDDVIGGRELASYWMENVKLHQFRTAALSRSHQIILSKKQTNKRKMHIDVNIIV